jgi:hypothetical protein
MKDDTKSGRYTHRYRDRVPLKLATAHHEAGHVVLGYWFGWWLNPDGVEIDDRWITNHRSPLIARTIKSVFVVSLAGWLAECKFHSLRNGNRDTDDIEFAFEQAELDRGLTPEHREGGGDLYTCAMYMFDIEPTATVARFAEQVAKYQIQTTVLLARPLIWCAVKRIAKALIARGRLSDDEAREIIGDDFEKIFEVGDWWT